MGCLVLSVRFPSQIWWMGCSARVMFPILLRGSVSKCVFPPCGWGVVPSFWFFFHRVDKGPCQMCFQWWLRPTGVIVFPTLTIGITDQNCCWWLACFSFIRMPPVRTSTRQAAWRNHAPAARGSAWGCPASRSGPRTSITQRAADGAHPALNLAAQEPGTSSGSSRTSVATRSPPGPTDPGLIAWFNVWISASNAISITGRNPNIEPGDDSVPGCTRRKDGTTRSARGCQCCSWSGAAEPYRYIGPKPYSTSGYTCSWQNTSENFAGWIRRLCHPTAAAEGRHSLHPGSRQPIWAAKFGVGPTVEEDQTAIHEMGRSMEHLCMYVCYRSPRKRPSREKGLVQWGEKHKDTSFEAKDRVRPALPPQHKSDACQTIVPKGFCWAYHNFGCCQFDKCSVFS